MKAVIPIEEFILQRSGERASLRMLELSDIPAVRGYMAEREFDKEEYFINTVEEMTEFIEKGWGIGCFLGGELIAHAFVCMNSSEPYSRYLGIIGEKARLACDFTDVFVAHEHRGNGLQPLLIELMEELAKQAGARYMLATIVPKNAASLMNFIKRGYAIEGCEPVYKGLMWYIVRKQLEPVRGKRALIVIDYTVDFVADEGRLTCGKPGQDIEDEIASLIHGALQDGDDIFICNDLHDEGEIYHPESRLFPEHNTLGSNGRELYGQVRLAVEHVVSDAPDRVHFLDKRRYSSFCGTPLDSMLSERGINTIVLCGVCTDICVLHTAVDAYNLGYDVIVSEKGVASFDMEAHEVALKHFKNSIGATLI